MKGVFFASIFILFIFFIGCPTPVDTSTTTTTTSTSTTTIPTTTTTSTSTTTIPTTTTTSTSTTTIPTTTTTSTSTTTIPTTTTTSTSTTTIPTTTTTSTSTTTTTIGTGKINFTLTGGKGDLTTDEYRNKNFYIKVFNQGADFKTATPIITASTIITTNNFESLNIQTSIINNGIYDLQLWIDKNGDNTIDYKDLIGKKTNITVNGDTVVNASAAIIKITITNVTGNAIGKSFGVGIFNEGETNIDNTHAVEGNAFTVNSGSTSFTFSRTFLEGAGYFISGGLDYNGDYNYGNSGDKVMASVSSVIQLIGGNINEFIVDYTTFVDVPN